MVSTSEDFIVVPDEDAAENYSISELVSSLKLAFRPSVFGRIERMLIMIEEKIEMEKQALKAKMQKNSEEMRSKEKRVVELETELEVYRNKYNELSVEFDKKKELEFRYISVKDELKNHKRTCDELNERIMSLEEDHKVVCEREKRAKERVINLSEELKKVERDDKEKFVVLKTENMNLENAKRRAENEIEVWRKRHSNLETRVLRIEEEALFFTDIKSKLFEKLKIEPRGLASEFSCEREGNKVKSKMGKIQSETDGEATNHARSEVKIERQILNCDGNINGSTCLHSTGHSLVKGGGFLKVQGQASINIPCKPSGNVREKKNSILLESQMEYGSRVIKQLPFEGNSNKEPASTKFDIVRPTEGIVEISDSDEDEKEITPEHTSSTGDNRMSIVCIGHTIGGALDHEKEMTSQKSLKRIRLDQNCEESESSFENLTPKRKRTPNSHVKRCSLDPTVSSGGQNVVESITPSQFFIPQRRSKGKRSGVERNSPNHLETSGPSHGKSGNPTAENVKENEVGRFGSNREGGCIVHRSEVPDSTGDSSDSEEAFKQTLLMIRRKTGNRLNWQWEADMLSTFEADPELCLSAVCALYRQQSTLEKSSKGSLHSNNRGFNQFDTLRGTALAEFLMDGNEKGDLKKTAKELEMFDPKALELCKELAKNYSQQLFSIYQSREDQFF